MQKPLIYNLNEHTFFPGFCIFLFLFSLQLALLYALLNGTDGSALVIIHCVAWLICVLLQVQRCQAEAACTYLGFPRDH